MTHPYTFLGHIAPKEGFNGHPMYQIIFCQILHSSFSQCRCRPKNPNFSHSRTNWRKLTVPITCFDHFFLTEKVFVTFSYLPKQYFVGGSCFPPFLLIGTNTFSFNFVFCIILFHGFWAYAVLVFHLHYLLSFSILPLVSLELHNLLVLLQY